MNPSKTLRSEIRDAMKALGMQANQLAKKSRLPSSRISELMSGKRPFRAKHLSKIIRAMDLNGEIGQRWHKLGAQAQGWEV